MTRARSTIIVVIVAAAASVTTLQAQTVSMNTTYAGGNGLYGAMFDLAATGGAGINIQSFDINTGVAAIWQVYVVTANTSWNGVDTTPSAWTLLATTGTITPAGVGLHTPLNLTLNYPIPGNGQKVGFYVTATSSALLTYTNGTTVNALYASDANLSFYEGTSKAIPQFTGGFSPRVFNGTVYYTTCTSNCPPAPCALNFTSPNGPGSIQMDHGACPPVAGAAYFVAFTFAQGTFPNGGWFGLDIGIAQIVNWYYSGYPFVGGLDGVGAAVFGP